MRAHGTAGGQTSISSSSSKPRAAPTRPGGCLRVVSPARRRKAARRSDASLAPARAATHPTSLRRRALRLRRLCREVGEVGEVEAVWRCGWCSFR